MNLTDWERNGWLIPHPTSGSEVRDHFRVIQSLRETLRIDVRTVNTFDAFRKKRNISGYERIGLVSDADAAAMRALAVKLRDDLITWIEKHRPELLETK